jgi:hypothetical protein
MLEARISVVEPVMIPFYHRRMTIQWYSNGTGITARHLYTTGRIVV